MGWRPRDGGRTARGLRRRHPGRPRRRREPGGLQARPRLAPGATRRARRARRPGRRAERDDPTRGRGPPRRGGRREGGDRHQPRQARPEAPSDRLTPRKRPAGPQILCELGRRLLDGGDRDHFDYAGPEEVFDELARVATTHAGITYAEIGGEGRRWPFDCGPVLYRASFETPDGRAAFGSPRPIEPVSSAEGGFALITGGRASDVDGDRDATARSLRLHPADADERGIDTGDPVVVSNGGTAVEATARRDESVRCGLPPRGGRGPAPATRGLDGPRREEVAFDARAGVIGPRSSAARSLGRTRRPRPSENGDTAFEARSRTYETPPATTTSPERPNAATAPVP